MGNISQLKFNKVELWIQIHDVPIIGMNRRSAKWMAKQIGRVIEIQTESKDCWGKFMKVKVQIDITKPLKRWLRLKLDKSEVIVMVSLKYERLPEFCYFCGRIGHASKECSDEEAKLEAMKGVSTKYGSWMRASAPDRQKLKTDQQNDGMLKIQGRLKDSDGLMIAGPSEQKKAERNKLVEDGQEEFGPGLINSNPTKDGLVPKFNMDGPNIGESEIVETSVAGQSKAEKPDTKQFNTRNWKRSARANKTEIIACNQPNFFRNLQTVSMKGKKSSKGINSTSTSKSKFSIAGKRSGLRNYKNSAQISSKERGSLSSSLKR
ncbi:hypothetical protein EZV62_027513 [Acer yangbiense]|uniref:CCHC-type domain-containing protein n=1 Tax=Acer yangbiense TaxID=1000413 RepID=A0A5C7GUP5_9ROSI|nr:hypothetical protein EZV62_027513 [Acer yangbiense]